MQDDVALATDTAEEFVTHLTDEEIIQIVEAVRAQDTDVVSSFLSELSAADAAELVAKVAPEDRDELLRMYGGMFAPEIFAEMDPELRRAALSAMPANEVASIVSALESDDAILLIETLDEARQHEIIHKLSAKTRVVLEEGLSFPEESAGRLMQRNLVAIPQSWTVGKTIDYMRAAAMDLPEDFFDIFVTDLSYHLIGVVPLNRLVRARRHEKIETLTAQSHAIPAVTDQEEVAHIFRRDDLTSAPVVDEEGRLLGVITIDDVIDVIDEEAQEDFLRLAGVDQGDLYRAALASAGTRFRWLLVNLLTAILASIVISWFGATIEQIVALAVLMPIVASMGGNAGTQALAVAVRALAARQVSQANTLRLVWKETLIGTLNGALFAVIAGIVAVLWFGDLTLGVVIAIAMVVNLIVAGLFGAGIPIMVARAGGDPAVSSAVFLTTVTDVVGFFAFLGLAALLMT